jgi:hypothetical protein
LGQGQIRVKIEVEVSCACLELVIIYNFDNAILRLGGIYIDTEPKEISFAYSGFFICVAKLKLCRVVGDEDHH